MEIWQSLIRDCHFLAIFILFFILLNAILICIIVLFLVHYGVHSFRLTSVSLCKQLRASKRKISEVLESIKYSNLVDSNDKN